MFAETLQHLLAAHSSPLAPIPALPSLHRGEVIEIQGPASSGKTHLLYHILLSFLVPVTPDAGPEIAVVVYDTETSFDIHRFRHLLLSRISRLPSALDPLENVQRSLARLHIFRPTSLVQLAVSIANLPAYHTSQMPNQVIAVLAIDSISTFYWPDRLSTEQLCNVAPKKATLLSLHHVFNAMQSVLRSHAPLLVLTNWALNAAPSHSLSPYRQHLNPFPTLPDDTADQSLNNTDHSSPLRLSHHIALSSPFDSSSPPPSADAETHLRNGIDNRQVCCLIKSSEAGDAVRFTFQITDDDILVQSLPS